jgi:hypothetical protein
VPWWSGPCRCAAAPRPPAGHRLGDDPPSGPCRRSRPPRPRAVPRPRQRRLRLRSIWLSCSVLLHRLQRMRSEPVTGRRGRFRACQRGRAVADEIEDQRFVGSGALPAALRHRARNESRWRVSLRTAGGTDPKGREGGVASLRRIPGCCLASLSRGEAVNFSRRWVDGVLREGSGCDSLILGWQEKR